MSAEHVPPPVGIPTLRAWRRTGLVSCAAALVSGAAVVPAALAGGRGTLVAVLGPSAFVVALIGLGFLRRAWSDPAVRNEPAVIRARRLSDLAMAAWGVAIVPNAVRAWRPEWVETVPWLSAVSSVLGCVAVASFVGMLVAAARWDPSDRSG